MPRRARDGGEDILARYRPQRFAELAQGLAYPGVARITGSVAAGKVGPIILHGPPGCGKTSVARLLGRALLCNCRQEGEYDPCNSCQACEVRWSSRTWGDMDAYEFDATNMPVADIVEMIKETRYFGFCFAASTSPWRFFFVDEVHRGGPRSAERYLKIVDDARRYVVFAFATTSPGMLPQALLERCNCVHIGPPPADRCLEWLTEIAAKEGAECEPGALERLVALTGCVPRLCLRYLQGALFVDAKTVRCAAVEQVAADYPRGEP
jgi:DNA polymerase-3 subunit gamma/tau